MSKKNFSQNFTRPNNPKEITSSLTPAKVNTPATPAFAPPPTATSTLVFLLTNYNKKDL